jgi:hypothetical protein
MNPWIAKALVLTGTVVMIAIRAPRAPESSCQGRHKLYNSARDRPLGSRLGRILRPSDLGRVASVFVRGVGAGHWPACRWCDLLGDRPLALPPVAR